MAGFLATGPFAESALSKGTCSPGLPWRALRRKRAVAWADHKKVNARERRLFHCGEFAQRSRYANKVVAVLGAGHSAVGTILDLAQLKKDEPATEIVWVLRGDSPAKSFGGGANDKLSARGELGKVFAQLVQGGSVRVETAFRLTHITVRDGKLQLGAGSACCGRHIEADELIVATGFHPDLSFLRELRTSLDPALECPPILAPLIDPNLHSCGTVRPHGARELAQPNRGSTSRA